MVGMNGVPKLKSTRSLADRVDALEIELEQARSARTYVNIGSIVEGGTIDANVGTQLTETVQKEIVIDRQNLAEAALTDVVVTGSIAAVGKTAEVEPKDIAVRMTTVTRDYDGTVSVANPALIFDTAFNQYGDVGAPGIYSPDGRALRLQSYGLNAANNLAGAVEIKEAGTDVLGPDIRVGYGRADTFFPSNSVVVDAKRVEIGRRRDFTTAPDVQLNGNVTINGKPLTQIQEFRATGTKANFDTANQDIGTLAPQTVGTNSPNLVTPGAGAVTITEAGVYSVDFQFLVGAAVTGRSFVDIADGNGTAYSRTAITVGEDQATGTLAGKLFNAGDRLRFRAIQTSGASRNYTAIIRIIKHP